MFFVRGKRQAGEEWLIGFALLRQPEIHVIAVVLGWHAWGLGWTPKKR
jgi:hypothetical protein